MWDSLLLLSIPHMSITTQIQDLITNKLYRHSLLDSLHFKVIPSSSQENHMVECIFLTQLKLFLMETQSKRISRSIWRVYSLVMELLVEIESWEIMHLCNTLLIEIFSITRPNLFFKTNVRLNLILKVVNKLKQLLTMSLKILTSITSMDIAITLRQYQMNQEAMLSNSNILRQLGFLLQTIKLEVLLVQMQAHLKHIWMLMLLKQQWELTTLGKCVTWLSTKTITKVLKEVHLSYPYYIKLV